jgi:DNA (cytosine-5)-methyltransferase 1
LTSDFFEVLLNMDKSNNPRCISLFAGAGGCSLGFKRAGYDVLLAIDNDQPSCETYIRNFPDAEVRNLDVKQVDWSALLIEKKLAPGELDVLIGGPPCQGFSTAGKRFWDDPRNDLLKSYVYALDAIRPKWFMMENVEGLLTMNNGEYLLCAVEAFVRIGYQVRLEKVYSHEYGVPQRRKRVIIVGNSLGIDFHFPVPTTPISGAIFRDSRNTFDVAVSDLPPPIAVASCGEASNSYPQGHHFIPQTGVNKQRIQSLLPGQTMKDLPEELQHDSFKRRAFRRVKDGTPSDKRGGAPSGLKRLIASEPSLTITSASTREFVHPTEDRCLTMRECARLQGFPDGFEFSGSAVDQIQQIGNAIPPMLAEVFARHIRLNLGFESSDQKATGALLGFSLTKADAMSPSLRRTHLLLEGISTQPSLFTL